MNINYDVWIQGDPAYTGLNTRTGTAAITDQDYEDFAPFTLAYYPTGANKYTMWNWINGGELSLDTEIDKSMCYVGMYNPDLPQLNIAAYAFDTYDTIDNPLYKTDSEQIQSYFCYDTWNFMFQQTQIPGQSRNYGDGRIYDKDFNYITNKLQIYKDGNVGTQPHVNPPNTINLHSWLNTYLSFGIKSLILEINVAYKISDGTYYPNQSRCTLAAYIANTTAWKEAHPILQAYCIPYIRDNTNGTYSNTGRAFESYNCIQTFAPAFTLPYLSQNSAYPDIVTYTTTLADGQSTKNGYFPLYGAMVGELSLSSSSTAIQNMGVLVPLMGVNKGTLGKRQSSGYMYYWLELDGSDDDNIEWLRRAAAAYGLFFCDDIGTLANAGQDLTRWIDNNMMLGTIDEDGRTNGDYTRGTQNVLQRQFNWTDTTQSNYDPSLPPVPENQYDNTTIFNSIGDSATMFKRYVLNGSNVEQLGRDLFKIVVDSAIDNPKYDDYATVINASFLVSDPLDSIISLQRYPMAIPHGSSAVENIKLGTNTCTAIGYPMSKTAYEYAFQGKKILPRFGDSFLDYEPYTKFEMYIPFCGTVELSPRDILNRELSARLVVDYSTGTCTGYILSDNLVIETLNGNIAINIPVAGIDSATIQGNISNAVANSRSAYNNKMTAAFGLAKSMVNPFSWSSGKQVGALGAAINAEYAAETANYSLEHIPAAPHTIGSASPCGAWAIDLKCRLIIYYPTGEVLTQVEGLPAWDPLKLAVYGMSTGFYTAEPAQISSFTSGLVCAQNPILNSMTTNSQSYPASSQELEMIRAAIADGIIL